MNRETGHASMFLQKWALLFNSFHYIYSSASYMVRAGFTYGFVLLLLILLHVTPGIAQNRECLNTYSADHNVAGTNLEYAFEVQICGETLKDYESSLPANRVLYMSIWKYEGEVLVGICRNEYRIRSFVNINSPRQMYKIGIEFIEKIQSDFKLSEILDVNAFYFIYDLDEENPTLKFSVKNRGGTVVLRESKAIAELDAR